MLRGPKRARVSADVDVWGLHIAMCLLQQRELVARPAP